MAIELSGSGTIIASVALVERRLRLAKLSLEVVVASWYPSVL